MARLSEYVARVAGVVAGVGLAYYTIANRAWEPTIKPPDKDAAVLLMYLGDPNGCLWDYDLLLKKWLEGEGQPGDLLGARAEGHGIVSDWNPNFDPRNLISEGKLALPDLDSNHRFSPELERCGVIFENGYDPKKTPDQNILRRILKESEPTLLARAEFRYKGHGRVITRTGKKNLRF